MHLTDSCRFLIISGRGGRGEGVEPEGEKRGGRVGGGE
jgi:hypothetical protein